MNRQPAFQFYPGDWHRDLAVQSLNFEQRGVWFEILLRMHDSEERGAMILNGKAMTDDEIASSIGWRDGLAKLQQILETLVGKGVANRRQNDGSIICRRMIQQNHLHEIRSAAGVAGALAKHSGKTVAKLAASSSSSTSSSSSNPSLFTPPAPLKGGATDRGIAEGIMLIWNEKRGPKEQARLTDKRLKKVRARLKDFTAEQLQEVVRKLRDSAFHAGDNDRGWRAPGPEWVLHSTEKVEQWLQKTEVGNGRQRGATGSRFFSQAEADREDAKKFDREELGLG